MYVFVELRVSSSVSHQWLCSGDASLASAGSRWPRFPAFVGTIKALRLPAMHALRLIDSSARSAGRLLLRVRSSRSRRRASLAPGRESWSAGSPPVSGCFPAGSDRTSQVSWRPNPVTLRRSTTPDDPWRLAASGASGAALTNKTMKASSFTHLEAYRDALSPPVYASRRSLPHAMQDSVPAG